MLGINISDVINVLKSVRPQLIVIGIVLILAVLISIFVNKRTVKDVAAKKMVRSQTWIAALIAVFAGSGNNAVRAFEHHSNIGNYPKI